MPVAGNFGRFGNCCSSSSPPHCCRILRNAMTCGAMPIPKFEPLSYQYWLWGNVATHPIENHFKSPIIALHSQPQSHQKTHTAAPCDRKSFQYAENRTPSPDRRRRSTHRREQHRVIRNHFRSPKSALPAPGTQIAS